MIKKIFSKPVVARFLALFLVVAGVLALSASAFAQAPSTSVMVNQGQLGFKIPNFSDILTFAIRAFFVIAGLAALFYLLLGAFGWVTSGGDKDGVTASREKIQAAVVGVVLIVAVLAIVVTLEQIVFVRKICFGISCPASIPGLLGTCSPNPQFDSTKGVSPSNPECCPAGQSGGNPKDDTSPAAFHCCVDNNADRVCD